GARPRKRLRHALCRAHVRTVPAPAPGREGGRPRPGAGDRGGDRRAPWRKRPRRVRAGQGQRVPRRPPGGGGRRVNDREILLVEDSADDAELTRIAFEEAGIPNRLVVVTDGAEALDYLFGRGRWRGRDVDRQPA